MQILIDNGFKSTPNSSQVVFEDGTESDEFGNIECCIRFKDGTYLTYIKGTESEEVSVEGRQWRKTADLSLAAKWSNAIVAGCYNNGKNGKVVPIKSL